jgi:nucleoside-diphosphate-sugar epimerase
LAVLILGVGYLGAALAAQLLNLGDEVVGFDNLSSTEPRAIDALVRHGSFRLVEGDVADPTAVGRAFDLAQPDSVFMLAAQSSANDDAVDPAYTELTNLRGPRIVFDECWRRGVGRVVFGSSLRVYGQPLPPTFDEETPYGPQRDLSHLSKIYSEKLLELYATKAADRATTPSPIGIAARLAIVYGLSPVMKRDYSFMTVPNRFCLQARRGEALRLVTGAGALSLLHVDDAVTALIRCLELPAGGYRPVNVLGEWMPLSELARCVAEEADRRGLTTRIDAPTEALVPVPLGKSALDDYGFERRRNVRGGVRELLDYYLADRE